MEIKYVDHPCSTADKKEWNKKGFRVIDSRFAPVEQKVTVKAAPKKPVATDKSKAEVKK